VLAAACKRAAAAANAGAADTASTFALQLTTFTSFRLIHVEGYSAVYRSVAVPGCSG
jgi:hypothetical protein